MKIAKTKKHPPMRHPRKKLKAGFSGKYPCYAVCINDKDNGLGEAIRRAFVYKILHPRISQRSNEVRVVDEYGAQRLCSAKWFIPIKMPHGAMRKVDSVRATCKVSQKSRTA